MNIIEEYFKERKQIVIEMLEKLVKEEKNEGDNREHSQGYIMGMEHSIDTIKNFL